MIPSTTLEMLLNKKAANYSTVYYLSSLKYWTKDFLVFSHVSLALITSLIIWQQLDKEISSSRIGENILVQKKWLDAISRLVECEIKTLNTFLPIFLIMLISESNYLLWKEWAYMVKHPWVKKLSCKYLFKHFYKDVLFVEGHIILSWCYPSLWAGAWDRLMGG